MEIEEREYGKKCERKEQGEANGTRDHWDKDKRETQGGT